MDEPPSDQDFIIGRQLGDTLRHYREKRGYTLTDLGDRLGLSYQQIQKYEQSRNRLPAARLYRLAQILDIPVQEFFSGLPEGDRPVENPELDEIIRAYKHLPEDQKALLYELATTLTKKR